MTPKILCFAGSARKGSYNKMLARAACDLANDKGADARFIDLADFDMPIFNEDLEAQSGLPAAAQELKKLFIAHQGIFIASPEYNSSFSALLKNSLDWISRQENQDEPPLIAFRDKVALISAASPGALGGLRGLTPLRLWLSNIQVHVLPQQLVIPKAHECFDATRRLTHETYARMLESSVQSLIKTTQMLNS